jgi:uncharacterized protein YciI
MLYAIMSTDVADSLEKRLSARPDHVKRLQDLQEQGRLVLAGPHPAIESEFESLDAAQRWADADPYIHAGVYASVIVKPFKKVFP